mgnify:FL=1
MKIKLIAAAVMSVALLVSLCGCGTINAADLILIKENEKNIDVDAQTVSRITLYTGDDINVSAEPDFDEDSSGEVTYVDSQSGEQESDPGIDVNPDDESIVPDVSDMSVSEAEKRLKLDGFVVRSTYEESDDIPKDYVIRTEPSAHEMAEQGSTVVLVVSLGPKNIVVNVPKFVGLPLNVAEQRAVEYHLDYRVEYRNSADIDKDVVMEQSIEPNTRVDRDTEIVLTVSAGMTELKSKNVKYTVPKKATGEFRFEYYVDGILDESATIQTDIGVSSGKTLSYTVNGNPGDEVSLRVAVTSVETGKSGLYMEVTVRFPADGGNADYVGDHLDVNIFQTLSES